MPDNRSFLESMAEGGRPESFGQEKFTEAKSGWKRGKVILVVAVVVVLLAGYFGITYFTNKVTVPDLMGMTLSEATEWAAKNNIILYTKSVFSLNDKEETILSQEIPAGQSINKNTAISLQISGGPDPEEAIAFPDIESMTADGIEAWIEENKLTGAKIDTAYSDIIEADRVIDYEFTDGSEDDFKRKNRVTITCSLGPEEVSETVVLSDFSAMRAGAILQWGAENGVGIVLEEAFDKYISAGSVISQSIKSGTEIKRTDSINIVISLGKPVNVPSFSSMSKEEANSWARLYNVTLTVLEKYSNSVYKGGLISQSIGSGSTMKEGDELKLTYSLGKVEVSSYIGRTKLDILNWQYDINTRGGGIVLNFSEAIGDKSTAGKIISQSIKNDYVNTGTAINVVISKGMRLVTPDFAGMTEAECNAYAKEAGLSLLFDYKSSSSVIKGYVISQSPAKDTIITDADTIAIVISMTVDANSVVVADFSGMNANAILKWGTEKGVNITLSEQYDNFIPAGSVILQSVAGNSIIKKTDTLIVYISKGDAPESIAAPNFTTMTKDEANAWARNYSITLTIFERYANTYLKGLLYGQSAYPGSAIYKGGSMQVFCSLGRVEVASFIGRTKLDILGWQSSVNEKGGSINLSFAEDYGTKGSAGKIISQSTANDYVDTGSTISVVISRGMKIITPDFDGKTETECSDICRAIGLTVLFDYGHSDTVANGVMISQSIASGTMITDANTITIIISLGTS